MRVRAAALFFSAIVVITAQATGVSAIGQESPGRRDLAIGPVGEVRTLAGGPAIFDSVAITPDGTTVVAGDRDGLLRIWTVGGGAIERSIRGRILKTDAVAISPDGRKVASCGPGRSRTDEDPNSFSRGLKFFEGSIIEVWNASTGRSLAMIEPTGLAHGLAFDLDGSTIAAILSGDAAGIGIWRADGGRSIRSLGGPGRLNRGMFFRGPEVPLAFGRDLKQVATLEFLHRDAIRLWAVSKERTDDIRLEADRPPVTSCALSRDGSTLAMIDADQVLTIWSTESLKIRKLGRPEPSPPNLGPFPVGHMAARRPLVLAYDRSGTCIVAGVADGTLRIYDASTAELLTIVRGPASPVRALAFEPDRISVISGGWSTPIDGSLSPSPLLYWQAGATPNP